MTVGEMADELLLPGPRAVPKKLMESGYRFRHSELKGTGAIQGKGPADQQGQSAFA